VAFAGGAAAQSIESTWRHQRQRAEQERGAAAGSRRLGQIDRPKHVEAKEPSPLAAALQEVNTVRSFAICFLSFVGL
jgi:hypothetical protein